MGVLKFNVKAPLEAKKKRIASHFRAFLTDEAPIALQMLYEGSNSY